ncbi:ATP-binding cassette domain-containing protein [Candidatus Uhrbacteria bacterium]|nr:ATP-binding cassette domain-containing protein [Candidatus Uhrbacteria bacterium]
MIKLQNVSKSFGTIKAVSDLTFEIKKGQIVGLLGPNGAGKSTSMRLMTGFLLPDSGTITIDGKEPGMNAEVQTKIGYLPENNPMYKDMLVSELLNFSCNLKNLNGSDRKDALDFAVKAVNIENVYYRPIRELSKGYKQRAGMAMALLARPEVLIMDEPTEGLDPNQRAEIRNLITELGKERTIVLSTHVMAEAAAVCNRLIIISKGKLVADGTPAELTQKSASSGAVIVQLQGENVEAALSHATAINIKNKKPLPNGRIEFQLTPRSNEPVQKIVSQLAHENNWILWKIAEAGYQLEEVFQSLTE